MPSGINHHQSSELNGLSSSATDNGLNRPVNLDPEPHNWSSPPTNITMPGSSGLSKSRQPQTKGLSNPYSRKQQDTITPARNNRVAKQTILGLSESEKANKRRKTDNPPNLRESRYFAGDKPGPYEFREIGNSTTENGKRSKTRLRPPAGVSVKSKVSMFEEKSRENNGTQGNASSLSSMKGKSPERLRPKVPFMGTSDASLHAPTTYIDLEGPDEDIGVPVAGPSRISNSSPTANAKGRIQAHERLNVAEPNENHAFCRTGMYNGTRFQSSPSSRIARDGGSAERLRKRYGSQLQTVTPSSPTLLREGTTIQPQSLDSDSDVEEIESVSDTRETRRPKEAKAVPNTTMIRDKGKDFATPAARLPYKPPFKKPPAIKHIPDLRKATTTNLKSRQMQLNMTKTSLTTNSRLPREVVMRDISPPAQHRRIPVLGCVWGEDVIEYSEEKTDHALWDSPSSKPPRYWLYWEMEHPQFYLALCNGEDSERRIMLEHIQGVTMKVCQNSSVPVVDLDLNFQHGLPEEIRNNGICFKFVAGHPDTHLGYSDFRSFLLDFANAQPESVMDASANACFEMKRISAFNSTVKNVANKAKPKTKPAVKDLPIPKSLRSNVTRITLEETQSEQPSSLPVKEPRQSSRLQEKEKLEKEKELPPENSNEVILVYPPSGAGGVHVTRGDLARLREEEFLNDTLIELGFKFWMNELLTENPELAEKVHIFSPFFFKKLSNKANKTSEDQHRSVQKWTAKVDIFQKEFIVVPVNENFHWYVMIVYKPAFILVPAPPKPPPQPKRTSKRKRTLSEKATLPMDVDVLNPDDDKVETTATTPETIVDVDEQMAENELMIIDTEAEAEVQDQLEACSLETKPVPMHAEREPSTSGDDFPMTISNFSARVATPDTEVMVLTDDEEYRSGQLVGGGPSAAEDGSDVDVIEDSLDSDDDVDELEQNDTSVIMQTEYTSQEVSELDSNPCYKPRQDTTNRTTPADTSVEYVAKQPPDKTLSMEPSANESMQADDVDDLDAIESVDSQDREKVAQRASSPVSANRFYGLRTRTYGKKINKSANADASSDVDELDLLKDEQHSKPTGPRPRPQQEPIEIDITEFDLDPRRTYVFSLDSMTTAHPKACGQISTYLMNEAKARKGSDNPSEAVCKKLNVSAQPNFSDCGLYLLHLTQVFLSNAEQLARLCAVSKRKKSELAELWKDDKVKTMRRDMRERILRESETWLKEKAEKEKKMVGAETSEIPDKESKSSERDEVPTSSATPAQAPGKDESDDELEVSEIHYVNGRNGQPPRNRPPAKKTAKRIR